MALSTDISDQQVASSTPGRALLGYTWMCDRLSAGR